MCVAVDLEIESGSNALFVDCNFLSRFLFNPPLFTQTASTSDTLSLTTTMNDGDFVCMVGVNSNGNIDLSEGMTTQGPNIFVR